MRDALAILPSSLPKNVRLRLLHQEDGDRGARWAGSVTFVSHGAVIGVRSTDTEILARISKALPTDAHLSDDVEADAVYSWRVERSRFHLPVHVITMKCRRDARGRNVARTTDVTQALAMLNHDAEFRVAMFAPVDVFIHCAVVEWLGAAILVPGYSFAGKSTLAAELVSQGAPYYSDEYAVLDATGHVRPFARRLVLRAGDGRKQSRLSAEDLGGSRGAEALPVGCVAVTRYVAGAHWNPRPLSPGEMALALLRNAIDVQERPTHVLARIALALGPRVIGLESDRGEAAVTARHILDSLTARASLAISRSA